MKRRLLYLCGTIFCLLNCKAQSIETPSTITVKKWPGVSVTIPITVKINNPNKTAFKGNMTLGIANDAANTNEQLKAADFKDKVPIRNGTITIDVEKKEEKEYSFYIVTDKSLDYGNRITINGTVTLGALTQKVQIHIDPAEDQIFTISDYLDNQKLSPLIKVESSNNILTLYGYKDNVFEKRYVQLKSSEVLAISKWSLIFTNNYFSSPLLSLTTIPIKIRNAAHSAGVNIPASATSGLNNIGLNFDLGKFEMERYFANGKKSTHKFSVGVLIAPTIEEMDSIYTNGFLGKATGKLEKSKQILLSTGITVSYSYNDITFIVTPIGWDLPTTPLGKKWVYGRKRWWGFGIGVSTKIFSSIFNK